MAGPGRALGRRHIRAGGQVRRQRLGDRSHTEMRPRRKGRFRRDTTTKMKMWWEREARGHFRAVIHLPHWVPLGAPPIG